jgi:adenosylmethionine-8-amino-7-oxononanoate aminotransferase
MGHLLSRPSPRPAILEYKGRAESSTETLADERLGSTVDELSLLTRAKGHYWYPLDGKKVLDGCGGAGVACIGHGRQDVIKAAMAQMKAFSYVSYAHFQTAPVRALSDWLIASTRGRMQKVYIMCSGKKSLRGAKEQFS